VSEIYAVRNAGMYPCNPMRRRRLLLAIGDRIQVTPRLSLTLVAGTTGPQQCWKIGEQTHQQDVAKPTLITYGGITRIVCRAASDRHALMEIQLDAVAASLDQRIAITRATA